MFDLHAFLDHLVVGKLPYILLVVYRVQLVFDCLLSRPVYLPRAVVPCHVTVSAVS